MTTNTEKKPEENGIPEPRRITAKEIAQITTAPVTDINRLFDQTVIATELPEGGTARVADLIKVYKYFESAKAGTHRTKRINIAIEELTDIHPLANLDAVNSATVERYAQAMASGDDFDPAIVFDRGGGKYLLVDGRHRIAAAKALGQSHFWCYVRIGTPDHQTVCAIAANNANGRGKSSKEKVAGIKYVLEQYKALGLKEPSTRKIGSLVGISHVAVQKHLNRLLAPEDTPKSTKKRKGKPQKPKECPIAELGISITELKSFSEISGSIPRLLEKVEEKPFVVASALRRVASLIEEIAKTPKAPEERP